MNDELYDDYGNKYVDAILKQNLSFLNCKEGICDTSKDNPIINSIIQHYYNAAYQVLNLHPPIFFKIETTNALFAACLIQLIGR